MDQFPPARKWRFGMKYRRLPPGGQLPIAGAEQRRWKSLLVHEVRVSGVRGLSVAHRDRLRDRRAGIPYGLALHGEQQWFGAGVMNGSDHPEPLVIRHVAKPRIVEWDGPPLMMLL
jgi:hypothetical protein